MPASTRIRLSRGTAERLLDGAGGPSELSRLLAAASAPGTADELAGEAVAVAAFAAARDTAPVAVVPDHRRSVLGTTLGPALSKIFGAKVVIAIALAAGATGGVALTTSSAGAPDDPPTAVTGALPTGTAAAGGSDSPVRPAGSVTAQPPAGLTAEGIGRLCRAWLAGDPDAAAELAAAAGGADEAGPAAGADGPATTGGADDIGALCTAATGSPPPDPDRTDTAPGQVGAAPGQADTAPGQAGTAPGQGSTAPGQADTAPGATGTAPGQAGTTPGQGETAPGRSGDTPGEPAAPGPVDRSDPPGQADRTEPSDAARGWEPSDADATTDR